ASVSQAGLSLQRCRIRRRSGGRWVAAAAGRRRVMHLIIKPSWSRQAIARNQPAPSGSGERRGSVTEALYTPTELRRLWSERIGTMTPGPAGWDEFAHLLQWEEPDEARRARLLDWAVHQHKLAMAHVMDAFLRSLE